MRIMSAVHPTTNQKRVLAKIVAAPTATVAAEEISKDANIVSARNMLMKLGMINFANNEASLTQQGTQVATEENIIDQGGQLTPQGQELAYTDTMGQTDSDDAGEQQDGGQLGMPPMESVSLLKQLLR